MHFSAELVAVTLFLSVNYKIVRLEPISGGQRQIMLHWVPATICFKKHFLF